MLHVKSGRENTEISQGFITAHVDVPDWVMPAQEKTEYLKHVLKDVFHYLQQGILIKAYFYNILNTEQLYFKGVWKGTIHNKDRRMLPEASYRDHKLTVLKDLLWLPVQTTSYD